MGNLPTYITLEKCFVFFMDDIYSHINIIRVRVKLKYTLYRQFSKLSYRQGMIFVLVLSHAYF